MPLGVPCSFPRHYCASKTRVLFQLRRNWRRRASIKRHGFVICLKVKDWENDCCAWLRLHIPRNFVAGLRKNTTTMRLLKHRHGDYHDHRFRDYLTDPKANGPFFSNFIGCYESAANSGSVVYCIGGDSDDIDNLDRIMGDMMDSPAKESSDITQVSTNKEVDATSICLVPRFCNFGSIRNSPQWSIGQPLSSPRYLPKLLVLESKLYVFSGNHRSQCFAEVFDLKKGYWEPLPCGEFGHIPSTHLIVAPFGSSPKKIMLFNKITSEMFSYDPSIQTWSSFDFNFKHHLSIMHGQPIFVEKKSTLYWLDTPGNICAFDWEYSEFYCGPIVGFSNEHLSIFFSDAEYYGFYGSKLTLLHLVDELFCIVWIDESSDIVHLTILKVRKIDYIDSSSPNHLLIVVAGCLSYKFNFQFDIVTSLLL